MPTEPERPEPDVTGMGSALSNSPVLGILFGAAAAFGAGGLAKAPAARQSAKPQKVPLSRGLQVGLFAVVWGPLIVLPLLLWVITGSWQTALIVAAIVGVCLFFGTVLIGGIVGYRRAKSGNG
jgi:hypothetical protein